MHLVCTGLDHMSFAEVRGVRELILADNIASNIRAQTCFALAEFFILSAATGVPSKVLDTHLNSTCFSSVLVSNNLVGILTLALGLKTYKALAPAFLGVWTRIRSIIILSQQQLFLRPSYMS